MTILDFIQTTRTAPFHLTRKQLARLDVETKVAVVVEAMLPGDIGSASASLKNVGDQHFGFMVRK